MTAGEFTGYIFAPRLGVSAVVAGYDFRFGADQRQGDADFLRAEGARLGFAVEIVERIVKDEAGSLNAVSSTATREALERGDVALARNLLGRPYFVEGVVVHGEKRGRGLGFPTANIALDPSNRLRYGVYAVTLEARGVVHGGVASFGRRPTSTTARRCSKSSFSIFLAISMARWSKSPFTAFFAARKNSAPSTR